MEGFLPPMWCAFWYILSGIVWIYGVMQLKKLFDEMPEAKPLVAIAGAYMFILSSLKMPSVTGSCSHPCGNGLGAVLFGPSVTAVLASIVLLFQALFLAHGGITTLGANVFSMGIVGPFVGWLIYKALKGKMDSTYVVGLAAMFADWATYATTSLQLTLAFPGKDPIATFTAFATVFAITQIPLAIAEGLLTMIIWDYLKKLKPDLLLKLGVIDESEINVNVAPAGGE